MGAGGQGGKIRKKCRRGTGNMEDQATAQLKRIPKRMPQITYGHIEIKKNDNGIRGEIKWKG